MREIEIKKNGFKFKKLLGLAACACMALSVISIPTKAEESNSVGSVRYTGDATNEITEKEYEVLNEISRNFIWQISDFYRTHFRETDTSLETIASIQEKIKEAKIFKEKQTVNLNFTGINLDITHEYEKYMNALVGVVGGTFIYDDVENITTIKDAKGSTNTFRHYDYRKYPIQIATSDAKDPSKVIDAIKNTVSPGVEVPFEKGSEGQPKAIFEAAKEANKTLEFLTVDESNKTIRFAFNEGITNPVEVNFGLKQVVNDGIVKDLEGAIAFDFTHSGALPGPMSVSLYNIAYKDVKGPTEVFLYLLDEKTGELVKQEQTATVNLGHVTFTITHCSSYVTTLTELTEEQVKVAEPKPDPTPEPNPETPKTEIGKKDSAIKAAGSQSDTGIAFKTVALITLCGAAVFIATRKEKA